MKEEITFEEFQYIIDSLNNSIANGEMPKEIIEPLIQKIEMIR